MKCRIYNITYLKKEVYLKGHNSEPWSKFTMIFPKIITKSFSKSFVKNSVDSSFSCGDMAQWK